MAGFPVHNQVVYHGADVIGTLVLYLVRNSQNELGAVLVYDGSRAAANSNFSVQTRLSVSFTPFRVVT